jgi:hypothetical protein
MLGPGLPLAPLLPLDPEEPLLPGVLATGPALDMVGFGGAGVRMVGAVGLGGKDGLALAILTGLVILGAGGVGRGAWVGCC